MKLKCFISFIVLVACLSCSNLSKNLVSEGSFLLEGGVYKDKKWNDNLVFKRVSWYQELTLLYDVIMARVDESSPFYLWFSEHEKRTITECDDFYVSLNYALDPDKISQGMFRAEMEKAGYDEFLLPRFASYLKLHPDFERLALKLYSIYGYCRHKESKGEIKIHFPGFEDKTL